MAYLTGEITKLKKRLKKSKKHKKRARESSDSDSDSSYRIDRGIRNTYRKISFEFLFIKTRPLDKLHNGFGFVIQFRVGMVLN